jgi:hypothetical protein
MRENLDFGIIQKIINFYDKMLTYNMVILQFTLTGFIMNIIVYVYLSITTWFQMLHDILFFCLWLGRLHVLLHLSNFNNVVTI